MSCYYGLYSSLPYTPTVPPPTALPHHYQPQPLPYYPLMHRQMPTPIPLKPIVTLATTITTPPYYQPMSSTLTPYLPPTPPTPSIVHPQPPQPPTTAPPPLTPTHQGTWEAKMAAQHAEIMHLLRLRLGLPTTPPPPQLTPQPTPSSSSPSVTPPSPTLPQPTITTLSPTSPITPSMPSPLALSSPQVPPTITFTAVGSPSHTTALLLEHHDTTAALTHHFATLTPPHPRSSTFTSCYSYACTESHATPRFEEGPYGHRIWNPGVPKHTRLTLCVPHLEDKVNFSGAGNDVNRVMKKIKSRGVYESLVNSYFVGFGPLI